MKKEDKSLYSEIISKDNGSRIEGSLILELEIIGKKLSKKPSLDYYDNKNYK